MKLSDFQKYIDLYGADLSRWPEHEIRSAVGLIQRDPEAGRILSAAEKLDHMLRHYPAPAMSTKALADRIMRQGRPVAVSKAGKPSLSLKHVHLLVPGGGLIVAAILGFLVGFHMPSDKKPLLDPVFYTQDQIINLVDEAS